MGTWAAIGSNKLSDINPTNNPSINPTYPSSPWGNQANVVNSWNGGAFDVASNKYVVWGGGHSDYGGNEVYGIDLSLDTPAWSILINPTGAVGNVGDLGYASNVPDTYFDGRPRSQHTYGNLVCVGGKMYALPGGAMYSNDGTGCKTVFAFDLDSKVWTSLASVASQYSTSMYGGGCDYDASRNVIWSAGYNKIVKYDITANTYTSPSSLGGISGGEFNCKHHAEHDLLVIFRHSIDALLYDPVANTLTTMPVTGTAPSFSWGHAGMVWDSVAGHYILWDGGADFATLTPPASSPKTNAWTWGSLTAAAGNSLSPAAVTNGTWTRLFISERYRCVGVQNATTDKLHIFALD